MMTVRYVCPTQIQLHVHTVEVEGSLREEASLALILSAFSTSLAIWAAAKEVKYHWLLNYVAHQTKLKIIQIIIWCKCFFLFTGREPTTWPANNCLQIYGVLTRNVVQLFLAANTILLMRKWNHAFSFLQLLLRENGRSLRFSKIFLKKQTQRSNDKTIIELGYRKISWFVSVSEINYSPSASGNNWSAHHWQITIFCSTSSNAHYLVI